MACKSMLNTRLTTATAVAAGGIVPLGAAVHGFGSSIRMNGNAIAIRGNSARAYYRVIAHITAEPTAAGSIAVNVMDGSSVIDTASETASDAGTPVDMTVISVVYVRCCCSGDHAITFILDSAANVTDFSVEIEQIS